MLKQPRYIAVGLVVLTTLIILNLPGHMAARLKLAIGGLFLPLRGVAGSGRESVDKAGDARISAPICSRNGMTSAAPTNNSISNSCRPVTLSARMPLRQYVGWQQRVPWKLKLARVVLHDPANWWRTAEIDVGSRDGIRVDMPVLTPAGLVEPGVVRAARTWTLARRRKSATRRKAVGLGRSGFAPTVAAPVTTRASPSTCRSSTSSAGPVDQCTPASKRPSPNSPVYWASRVPEGERPAATVHRPGPRNGCARSDRCV